VCCSDVREIGNVDEGVIERGEDACDAEDKLACVGEGIVSLVPGLRWGIALSRAHLRGPEDRAEHSPSQRARPSSWEACLLGVVVLVRVFKACVDMRSSVAIEFCVG